MRRVILVVLATAAVMAAVVPVASANFSVGYARSALKKLVRQREAPDPGWTIAVSGCREDPNYYIVRCGVSWRSGATYCARGRVREDTRGNIYTSLSYIRKC